MMDWITPVIGTVGTLLGGGVALGGKWIAAKVAARKADAQVAVAEVEAEAEVTVAELEHDARIAPGLLTEIQGYRAEVAALRLTLEQRERATEECERRHRQRDEVDRRRDAAEAQCKQDLSELRDQVREIARTLRTQRSTPPDAMAAVSGRTVLVVDDDADARRSIAQLCESLGHRAIVASSTAAALATLATEARIDVVLADVVMPGASGVELVEAVRRSRRRVPVVLVTGVDPVPDAGVIVLRKPVSRDALARTIDGVLDDTGRFEIHKP